APLGAVTVGYHRCARVNLNGSTWQTCGKPRTAQCVAAKLGVPDGGGAASTSKMKPRRASPRDAAGLCAALPPSKAATPAPSSPSPAPATRGGTVFPSRGEKLLGEIKLGDLTRPLEHRDPHIWTGSRILDVEETYSLYFRCWCERRLRHALRA